MTRYCEICDGTVPIDGSDSFAYVGAGPHDFGSLFICLGCRSHSSYGLLEGHWEQHEHDKKELKEQAMRRSRQLVKQWREDINGS